MTVTVTSTTAFQYFNPGDAVSIVSDTAGRVDLAGNTQSRTHVYTWITPWGEESIASEPSDALYIKVGQVVTITNIPTATPASAYYIRGVRVYRTLSSASGTEYWKLSDLWFPVSTATVARTGNVSTVTLAEPHNFIVVDRKSLVNYVEDVVDMGKPVRKSFLAKYKTYRRAGRQDLLTMVELSQITANCKHFIWEK